jgi:hypothetical protein
LPFFFCFFTQKIVSAPLQLHRLSLKKTKHKGGKKKKKKKKRSDASKQAKGRQREPPRGGQNVGSCDPKFGLIMQIGPTAAGLSPCEILLSDVFATADWNDADLLAVLNDAKIQAGTV